MQFRSFFSASSAISAVNGTQIQGRLVHVDWAVNKTQHTGSRTGKGTPDDGEDSEKESIESESADLEEEDVESEGSREDNSEDDIEEENGNEGEDYCDSEEDDDDGANEGEEMGSPSTSHLHRKPQRTFSDVSEGRTVFIR